MSGKLYIVATPIGNLEDLTPRAARVFSEVDFIAAEDTRVTIKLLNHLGIKKPMVSYFQHNLKERGSFILKRIQDGENCALCSDAGMPAISDPGEIIVRDAHELGIEVVPVPAACAAATALSVSGQITGRWIFEGFLPTNRRQKKDRLSILKNEERTIIFYEAPHKLTTTLKDFIATFGDDRSVTICRELTKLHEEIKVTTVGEAYRHYSNNDPRGEFVLVLAGAQPCEEEEMTLEDAVNYAIQCIEDGQSATQAAKSAAAISSYSKSEIYKLCVGNKGD